MDSNPTERITDVLLRWDTGGQACVDALIPLVEPELRRMAHQHMRRERDGHTLQTTALVNEAYLKLVDQSRTKWQNRAHFLGAASRVMRRILIDHARTLGREKRAAFAGHVPLDEALVFTPAKSASLIALDDALERLARIDERKVRVVEARYFGGLSVEETAEALAVHPNTVINDWAFAKAWLAHEVSHR